MLFGTSSKPDKFRAPHRTAFSCGPDISGKSKELCDGCLPDYRNGVAFTLDIEYRSSPALDL